MTDQYIESKIKELKGKEWLLPNTYENYVMLTNSGFTYAEYNCEHNVIVYDFITKTFYTKD